MDSMMILSRILDEKEIDNLVDVGMYNTIHALVCFQCTQSDQAPLIKNLYYLILLKQYKICKLEI